MQMYYLTALEVGVRDGSHRAKFEARAGLCSPGGSWEHLFSCLLQLLEELPTCSLKTFSYGNEIC